MNLDFSNLSTEDIRRQTMAAQRMLAIKESRDGLLPFTRLTTPHSEDVDDPTLSDYEITPQSKILAEVFEKCIAGTLQRAAVSIGPQHGKSELLSRRGPSWAIGKRPKLNFMLGTYNQDKADEFGDDVRAIIRTSAYKQVFPKFELRTGASAKDFMVTMDNGKMSFVGVGASGTGKAADIFGVDDPYRNDEDAQSATYREKVWKWFTRVVHSRTHKRSSILVVHTRWHEDDLIGRLCDPNHPERKGKYAGVEEGWTYIDIPAVVTDPALAKALGLTLETPTDERIVRQFGSKPMSALWPERKDLKLLAEARMLDARGFDALYMGKPSPDDGHYFKAEWLVEYDRGQLPKNLRKYGASDHAVTEKQQNDPSVIGCVGVDENNELWVLPDLVWDHMETDRTVEEIIAKIKLHKPLLWWLENELISKSFGPFLKKRMIEASAFVTLDPVTPTKDKQSRARAIQGMMQLKRVHFPRFAPWWPDAKSQILKFPFATHDDFVDWLAWLGLGLMKEVRAVRPREDTTNVIPIGSPRWIMHAAKQRAQRETREKNAAGF